LQNDDYEWPAYITFLLTAYDQIYNWNRLNFMFKTPYDQMVLQLFDGSKSANEINSQLPSNLTDLIKDDFVAGVLNETDTLTVNAFKENSLLDWVPVAPIRLFHGDQDEVASYTNALKARDRFLANGATQVELITLEGKNHASAGLPAVLGMISWLETFRIISPALAIK
jgi:hypothetical protein